MEIKTVYAVYFSATGRTRKVVTTLANAIAQTLELPLETVDFTLPAAREETEPEVSARRPVTNPHITPISLTMAMRTTRPGLSTLLPIS